MLRAAVREGDRAALTAPAPFVDLTHAPAEVRPDAAHLRDVRHRDAAAPALPNCARTGSLTCLPAAVLAGKRPFAAASADLRAAASSCSCRRGPSRASRRRAPSAYFVTMKPWTPRNGTDGYAIVGTWMILNLSPLFLSVSDSHGPVIQKAACPLRNAFFAVAVVDLRVDQAFLVPLVDQRGVLEELLVRDADVDGSRLPALFVPKT